MRRESFVGVGQLESFSQTKTNAGYYGSASTQPAFSKQKTTLRQRVLSWRRNAVQTRKGLLRYTVHASVIALAAGLVLAGGLNANSSSALRSGGNGATTDQTSFIATGAMLTGSQGVLGREVGQKAQDLSAQIALNTAGDDFLAKKTPIAVGSTAKDISTYKVKEGDTLGAIAQKFNITSDTIKWVNGVADETALKPGTNLTILPVSGMLHHVIEGDSLEAIAAKYQANVALIDSFNNLEGKAPVAGARLVIPDGVVVPTNPAPAANTRLATTNGFANNWTVPGLGGGGSIGNSYSYGFCTWYVASRRAIPGSWGNAYSWLYAARASGYGTGSTPRVGAVAWERGNHVAYVEGVNPDGTVTISEMNFYGNGGGWGRRSYRTTAAGKFMYIY